MIVLQLNEVRKAYFLQVFGREIESMRIISFGRCNYQCPYCKRDGFFRNSDGSIIGTYDVPMEEVKKVIDSAILRGQRIRLSGGDPCCFQKEAMEIAQYVWEEYGQKISIAHNGSSPKFARSIAPYLDYAAIDCKSTSRMPLLTGYKAASNKSSLEIINDLSSQGILVDVRTPIFKDTTLEEIQEIAQQLPENTFYTLRKYNAVEGCSLEEPSAGYVKELVDQVHKTLPNVKIGCRDKWTGCQFYIPD